MKTLLLMRHAKSSWSETGLPDHDRPLNKRGKRDAPRMGTLLRDQDLVPDAIISSTAKRARSTARRVAEACGFGEEIPLSADLYGADLGDFVNTIQSVSDTANCLLLVSHNPGTEYMVEALGGGDADMPTAAIAHFRVDCAKWGSFHTGSSAELVRIWRPKEMGDAGAD